jgi:hypothetical protein
MPEYKDWQEKTAPLLDSSVKRMSPKIGQMLKGS